MKLFAAITLAGLLVGCTMPNLTEEKSNKVHFVARTKHLLELVRKHPAPAKDPWFQINGVQFWPSSPISVDALRVMDIERGTFNPAQRDQALQCGLPKKMIPDPQVVLLETNENRLVVPVFLASSGKGLSYLDLSIDRPGAPVVLVITGYNGLAVRISVSPATRLAAVHLNAYYPSVVLGVEPEKVTQQYYGEKPNSNCHWAGGSGSAIAKQLGYGSGEILHYKTERESHFVIGTAQPTSRKPPTLGTFLDPEMPAPSTYGIVVLADRGYIRPVKIQDRRGSGTLTAFEVVKPFFIPAGLAGSHSVTFILRPESPVPLGDLAHSSMVRQTK